jgi:hypothetical protein
MIPKPTTPQQALQNAILAAEEAHAQVSRLRPGTNNPTSWSRVAEAWTRIGTLMLDMPEMDERIGKADRKAAIDSVVAQIMDRVEAYMRHSFSQATIDGVLASIRGPQIQTLADDDLSSRWGPDLTKKSIPPGYPVEVTDEALRRDVINALILSHLYDEDEEFTPTISHDELLKFKNRKLIVERVTSVRGLRTYRVRAA